MSALLRAEGVSVKRAERTVVEGVSFALAEGEVTALLGPNGAGKSTLLEGLAGLLPTHGSIERTGRVAMALQAPDLAHRSVHANVTAALRWWGVPRDLHAERASGALRAMAAEHLADRAASTLSGGERRRVHLARALAVRPDVLLLDEPFAGLDVATRATLLEDAGSALRQWTRAALVVVHDRAESWALADRLLILLDGRIVADGAPRELLDRPPTLAVARFLGFTGELPGSDGSVLVVRPQQVVIDADGDVEARVQGVIPLEDGLRLELAVGDRGRLSALAPLGATAPGDVVRLRVTGGARFDQPAPDRPVQPVSP